MRIAGEPGSQAAAAPPTVNSGDTAWVLISAALVMLMTPGLAFFYGGLVRRKNMLSVLMQCFMILCLISLQWVLFGYSLSFGPDKGLASSAALDWAFLQGVGATPNADYAATIPHQAFMIFQMMFAVITPALIIGAFAERMQFSAFCCSRCCGRRWSMTRWPTGSGASGGFLRQWGALDFAGGTVVHINAGMAALAAALVLGRRQGYPGRDFPAAQPAVRGAGRRAAVVRLVRLQRRQRPGLRRPGASAFVATHVAAATAGVIWALLDWIEAQEADDAGHDHRRGRRSGGHHAGVRVRDADGRDWHRRSGPA